MGPGQCDSVPFSSSSWRSPLHSERKMLAPVRLPSPPHTHRLEMPRLTRLKAAAKRPSRVVKALQRALPITVPPWVNNTCTAANHALVISDFNHGEAFTAMLQQEEKLQMHVSAAAKRSHTCIRVKHSVQTYKHKTQLSNFKWYTDWKGCIL